ncbi:MAG: response regulator [Tannerellaceae bacterium]|jgi:signal transduction histidine kinase/CheY-like chemotaxis protein/HPt (histidine-containing phosphotransfer) domain-containing protein|nr:response regulator [Tannerellaceae bacterium]
MEGEKVMAKNKEHLTRIVILGYASSIILAAFAVFYIFNLVARIAKEKDRDEASREKIYIITDVLSLLYEGETYTQFVTDAEEEFEKFNKIIDKVHGKMEMLRLSIDCANWEKIDTINLLLERKRENTKFLLDAVLEMRNVFDKSITKEIPVTRKLSKELGIQKQEESTKDTVVLQRQRKSFFKRLAEAFVPAKVDTAIRVNVTSRTQTDSLINTYDPSKDIATVLLRVQQEITRERSQLTEILINRTRELRQNNNIIANEINRILAAIEDEKMAQSKEEEEAKQGLIHDASKHLAVISVIAIVIMLFFLFLTLRDIWKSRYYRKQLEKAKQYAENLLLSRERLMLTISHDIRAPLSSILGYIELLKKSNPGETQDDYLDNMNSSAKHILLLVNDLLDFHRLDSGKMEIHPNPFHVPTLFKEIHAGFTPLADAKGLALMMDLEDTTDMQTYVGDTVRIRQVVSNLLSNAIKFTQEGKIRMNVSVAPVNEERCSLKVSVKDDGPGIAEEEQKKIFGEFTRLAGSEKTDGFGLGLSITGKLVALMGGEISLQSAPGEGAEFTIILPLQLSDEEFVEEDATAKEDVKLIATGRKINCLVIDDDKAQIKLTEELLRRNHVNVISSTNPHMAIDLLGKASFDIIFTDIQMPGMTGYELLGKVRASGINGAGEIPVVALSASVEENKEHYKDAGFTDSLSKPFTSGELISLLNRLLSGQSTPVNISSLTSFAGDDKEAINSILQTFSEETRKSLGILQEALAKKDKEQAGKTAHKMIPLLKMLEAHGLVEQLRLLEKKEVSGKKWEETITDVIKQTNNILEEIWQLTVDR